MWRGAVNRQPGYRARNLQRWNKKQRTQRKQRNSRPKSEKQQRVTWEAKEIQREDTKNIGVPMRNCRKDTAKIEKHCKTQNSANLTTKTARNPTEKPQIKGK